MHAWCVTVPFNNYTNDANLILTAKQVLARLWMVCLHALRPTCLITGRIKSDIFSRNRNRFSCLRAALSRMIIERSSRESSERNRQGIFASIATYFTRDLYVHNRCVTNHLRIISLRLIRNGASPSGLDKQTLVQTFARNRLCSLMLVGVIVVGECPAGVSNARFRWIVTGNYV